MLSVKETRKILGDTVVDMLDEDVAKARDLVDEIVELAFQALTPKKIKKIGSNINNKGSDENTK